MAKKLPRSGSLQESQNTLCKCICFCSLFSAYPFFLLIFLIIFLPFFCLQVRESLDFSCVEVWRTHDWSHGLPIVRQAFSVLRPGYTFPSIFFPASSVRCICLPAVSYSDSLSVSLRWQSYYGAGFLSGLSPRLPRFPEVPLLRYLVISVSGVLIYMWPVLPVAGLTVTSEESVCRFVCYRETGDTASCARVYQTRAGFPALTHASNYFNTDEQLKLSAVFPSVDNLYPFVLEHLCPNLIYILLSVDIAVMPGSAFWAYPLPDAQILNICIFIPAAAAGLWWWIPSADFSEILASTFHLILYHC